MGGTRGGGDGDSPAPGPSAPHPDAQREARLAARQLPPMGSWPGDLSLADAPPHHPLPRPTPRGGLGAAAPQVHTSLHPSWLRPGEKRSGSSRLFRRGAQAAVGHMRKCDGLGAGVGWEQAPLPGLSSSLLRSQSPGERAEGPTAPPAHCLLPVKIGQEAPENAGPPAPPLLDPLVLPTMPSPHRIPSPFSKPWTTTFPLPNRTSYGGAAGHNCAGCVLHKGKLIQGDVIYILDVYVYDGKFSESRGRGSIDLFAQRRHRG